MRNINICLIALASILFLLINLYGLLEILRYFKLKQLKDLQERLRENRLRGESNWHTVFTSTSLYDISTEADETAKSHRPSIEFLPRTTKRPSIPYLETTTETSILPTTSRLHVTTPEHTKLSTVESIIPTSTILSTVLVTTSRVETSKASTHVPTPRIVVTTKPDWFLDSRQLEEQRRHNAERRRQQLIREETERRLREEEETKKRLEQEIQERKQKEKEERERIHKLGEERRQKEHAEKMEARRIQAIEEARRRMLLKQEQERIEIENRRRSEMEKKKLEERQKEELEKLRLQEEQELIKKQKLEIEQRRLVEQQHREREKLREELRQIEHLRRQKLEENEIEEKLLEAEDREEEGKTIEMSLEEEEEEEDDMELDEHFRVRATTPRSQKNGPTHLESPQEPSLEDWSTGRHKQTTTLSPKEPVETPEPPRNEEVTIVTAFLDIGRGEWFHYQRPLEKYHEFMENLLSLQNNMVIFTDKSSYDFVHKYRKKLGLMHMTKIHMIQFDDLPLSRHLPYAQKIIEDEMNNDDLYLEDPDMKNHPEAKSAEYDIVVNSKTYFLYNTTMEDPFQTDFFVWIDAGYGHGNQNVYPYDNVWKPKFPRNKISMIKLTPEHDPVSKYKIDNLYRRNWSVMSGGFIAGDKRSIGQLYTITHNKFIHLIYQNKVDDDQTVMVLAINSYPHLFDIKQGDWFDAFRLYSDPDTPFGAKAK